MTRAPAPSAGSQKQIPIKKRGEEIGKIRARITIPLSADMRAFLKENPAPPKVRPEAAPMFPKAHRIVQDSGKVSILSLLKAAGVPDATVMALVGHETLAMSSHYTHF
jgi:hypothetical protein